MRRSVFRENLHRLADAHELDFDGLCKTLGFIREDKKWLRRLWRDGLDQLNSRRKEELKKLANHLGLLDSRQLWESNVAVSVSAMMQTSPAGFIQVAARTSAYFAALQHLYLRCPQEIDELLQRYDMCDTAMVAAFVAASYNINLEYQTYLDLQRLKELTEQFQSYQKMHNVERVREKLETHPAWIKMVSDLHQAMCGKSSERMLQDVSAEIERRMQAVIRQPPSIEEIATRFTRRYLIEDESEDFVRAMEIVAADPMWQSFIASKGNESNAIQFVRKHWSEAQINLIEPENFASSFKAHYF